MARPFYSAPTGVLPRFSSPSPAPRLPFSVPTATTAPLGPVNVGDKPWMTPQLLSEIRRRNALQAAADRSCSAADRAAYEQVRHQVGQLINGAKERFCLAYPHLTDVILQQPPRPFACRSCDRFYRSQQQLDLHLSEHVTCPHDGCTFTAHQSTVDKHITMQHDTGMAAAIMALNTPEAVARWRDERRKNFATAENVERRRQEREERLARGERLGLTLGGRRRTGGAHSTHGGRGRGLSPRGGRGFSPRGGRGWGSVERTQPVWRLQQRREREEAKRRRQEEDDSDEDAPALDMFPGILYTVCSEEHNLVEASAEESREDEREDSWCDDGQAAAVGENGVKGNAFDQMQVDPVEECMNSGREVVSVTSSEVVRIDDHQPNIDDQQRNTDDHQRNTDDHQYQTDDKQRNTADKQHGTDDQQHDIGNQHNTDDQQHNTYDQSNNDGHQQNRNDWQHKINGQQHKTDDQYNNDGHQHNDNDHQHKIDDQQYNTDDRQYNTDDHQHSADDQRHKTDDHQHNNDDQHKNNHHYSNDDHQHKTDYQHDNGDHKHNTGNQQNNTYDQKHNTDAGHVIPCERGLGSVENGSRENEPGHQTTGGQSQRRSRRRGGRGRKRSAPEESPSGPPALPSRKRRRRGTLLEKLLAPDIERERNIILQCVRYITDNNFFDGRVPRELLSDAAPEEMGSDLQSTDGGGGTQKCVPATAPQDQSVLPGAGGLQAVSEPRGAVSIGPSSGDVCRKPSQQMLELRRGDVNTDPSTEGECVVDLLQWAPSRDSSFVPPTASAPNGDIIVSVPSTTPASSGGTSGAVSSATSAPSGGNSGAVPSATSASSGSNSGPVPSATPVPSGSISVAAPSNTSAASGGNSGAVPFTKYAASGGNSGPASSTTSAPSGGTSGAVLSTTSDPSGGTSGAVLSTTSAPSGGIRHRPSALGLLCSAYDSDGISDGSE